MMLRTMMMMMMEARVRDGERTHRRQLCVMCVENADDDDDDDNAVLKRTYLNRPNDDDL